jgi:hypothetical protein
VQHLDATAEKILSRLAYRAHGLVRRRHALRAGISVEQIRTRLHTGALLVEYPGVYRVGHRAPSLESSYLAAVWACGDRTLLAGGAAGYLLELLKGPPPRPEVLAPTKRRIDGIITRRYRVLHRNDRMTYRSIPVTSPARTLVDLAPQLGITELARACHEAGIRHGTTPAQVEEVLARRPNSPGAGKLRAVISGDAHVLLSKLEEGFIALLMDAKLPLPETNRRTGAHRVDCRWAEHRLTVELDSFRYHNSRQSWERDRARERDARARGDEFRRYTWMDVFEEPRPTVSDLRALLGNPI